MGTAIGLVIGYMLGSRAGEDGWKEFRESWKSITASEEVRDVLSGGISMVGDLVQRGSGLLAERLQPHEPGVKLHRVA